MKDLMAKVGEYTNSQGETKGEWVKVGAMGETENGPYLLLDPAVDLAGVLIKQRLFNPEKAGKSVIVSVFDNQNSNTSNIAQQSAAAPQQAPQAAPPAMDSLEDDIPF